MQHWPKLMLLLIFSFAIQAKPALIYQVTIDSQVKLLHDLYISEERIPYRDGVMDFSIWSEYPLRGPFCYFYFNENEIGKTLRANSVFKVTYIHGSYFEDTNNDNILFGGFGTYFESKNLENNKLSFVCESPLKTREVSLKEMNRAFKGILLTNAKTPYKEFRGRKKEPTFGNFGHLISNAKFTVRKFFKFYSGQKKVLFENGNIGGLPPRNGPYCILNRSDDYTLSAPLNLNENTSLKIIEVHGNYYRFKLGDSSLFETIFNFKDDEKTFALICFGPYRDLEISKKQLSQTLGRYFSIYL